MHQLRISWDPVASPVDGYNVYRGPKSDNATRQKLNTALVVGNEFFDDNVFAGDTYFYEVTSVRAGLESADSLEVKFGPVPFPPSPNFIPLGEVRRFGILGASTVTNTGPSTIRGDVGVSPGTSITGFESARITGVFQVANDVAAAGQVALTSAYLKAEKALNPGGAPATTLLGDIGGTKLTPGVYKSGSSLGITGNVVLDGEGNPNAVFIFQIGSTLTVAGSVTLVNGVQANNVYWQVGSSATIGVGSQMVGIVMAQASITANTNAVIEGMLLARTGAVTVDSINLFLNLQGPLISEWTPFTRYELGSVLFDCVSNTFQWVTQAGTSGEERPVFKQAPSFTKDGTVVWIHPNIQLFAQTPILPPLQAVPPPPPVPPEAPVGVEVVESPHPGDVATVVRVQ